MVSISSLKSSANLRSTLSEVVLLIKLIPSIGSSLEVNSITLGSLASAGSSFLVSSTFTLTS